MVINVGDPIILKDAKGLKKYGLTKGMEGTANSVVSIPSHGDYLYFMPDGTRSMFVIEVERCVLDEDKLAREKEE